MIASKMTFVLNQSLPDVSVREDAEHPLEASIILEASILAYTYIQQRLCSKGITTGYPSRARMPSILVEASTLLEASASILAYTHIRPRLCHPAETVL